LRAKNAGNNEARSHKKADSKNDDSEAGSAELIAPAAIDRAAASVKFCGCFRSVAMIPPVKELRRSELTHGPGTAVRAAVCQNGAAAGTGAENRLHRK
jgi:hypothetical protein